MNINAKDVIWMNVNAKDMIEITEELLLFFLISHEYVLHGYLQNGIEATYNFVQWYRYRWTVRVNEKKYLSSLNQDNLFIHNQCLPKSVSPDSPHLSLYNQAIYIIIEQLIESTNNRLMCLDISE